MWYLGTILNDKMIYVHFQGKPFDITVIQIYAQTTNANEAEVDQFYEVHKIKRTPKDVLFMIGDWNGKVGSQEIPGVSGKFGLRIQNEAGQKLTVLPREDTGNSKNHLPTTQEITLHMDITRWSIPKPD